MKFYYVSDGEKKGPYLEADFYELVQQGVIDNATYVWWHGLKQWALFGDVREIYLGQVRLQQSASSGLTQPAFAFNQKTSLSNLSFAGFWIRVAATLIDIFILLGIDLGVALLFGFSVFMWSAMEPGSAHGGGTAILAQLFQVLLPILYSVYFVGKYGATPGKKAVGIRIIREDGSPVGYGLALGRFFAKILSALIFYIGYIMIAFTSQKCGLHDYICRTRVIKMDAKAFQYIKE